MDLSEQVNCPCLASHSLLFPQKWENFRMDAAMTLGAYEHSTLKR